MWYEKLTREGAAWFGKAPKEDGASWYRNPRREGEARWYRKSLENMEPRGWDSTQRIHTKACR